MPRPQTAPHVPPPPSPTRSRVAWEAPFGLKLETAGHFGGWKLSIMFNFGLNSRRLPTATLLFLSSNREGSSFSTRPPPWSGAQRRRRERWWRCLLVRVTAWPRSRCQYILAGAGQTCGARRQARTCRPQSGGAQRSDSRSSWVQRRTPARRAAPHPLRRRQPRCPNLRAEEGELGGPRLPDRVCPVSLQVPCLNLRHVGSGQTC